MGQISELNRGKTNYSNYSNTNLTKTCLRTEAEIKLSTEADHACDFPRQNLVQQTTFRSRNLHIISWKKAFFFRDYFVKVGDFLAMNAVFMARPT